VAQLHQGGLDEAIIVAHLINPNMDFFFPTDEVVA
jgi:hypothetical protein